MLLNTFNHRRTVTNFTISILVPLSRLGLFMLYLCDLIFICSPTFIIINYTFLLKQTHLLLHIFLEHLLLFLNNNIDEESE